MRKKSTVMLSLMIILSLVLSSINVVPASAKTTTLAKSISIVDPSTSTVTVAKGKTKKLTAKISPTNVSSTKLKWVSDNKSIVTVSSKGVIKGIKAGTTDVTTSTTDGSNKKATIKVTVGTPVTKVTTAKSKVTLTVGKTSTIKATISPKNASNKGLIYKSSNEKVATISKSGKLKAISTGTATIAITAKDGSGKYTKVNVTVEGKKVEKTLTETDVVNGKIALSNKVYDKLTINKSVGDAEIILDNVTVKDTLEMEANASYIVKAKDSDINKVVALEEQTTVIRAFAIGDTENSNETPTFIAESGTLVVNIDARGNVSVRQESEASIGIITVNRMIDGNIELEIQGFDGNLVVNTISNADVAITTKNCNIAEASIAGTSAGQKITLTDDSVNGEESIIGKINVETKASISIDIPATELAISEEVKDADITVEKPIEKITNDGSSTTLKLNSNVTNIVSAGEELALTVAAGSTVKEISASGDSTQIEVALGSKIESVISKGDSSVISGAGTVEEVKVEGDNNQVNTAATSVEVAEDAAGTTTNGTNIPAGTTNQETPTPVIPTPTEPQAEIPEIGTAIKINDPGVVRAGEPVQLTADLDNVTWNVVSYIDETDGYANIEQETGILSPYVSGTVRVIATSNLNDKVYGAVDITIKAKKFVKYEPLAPVEISTDESLISVDDLANSGKLPQQVRLVYETGEGSNTETITVELSSDNWWGSYDADLPGKYLIYQYIQAPDGYENPSDFYVSVLVNVTASQTDTRKEITGYTPLEPIILSEDLHKVDIDQIIDSLFDKTVSVQCGEQTFTCNIEGIEVDSAQQYNGAVKGTYQCMLHVPLPNGYKDTVINGNAYSYYSVHEMDKLIIPIDIIVNTEQTVDESNNNYSIPETTQPAFSVPNTIATIESISLNNAPTEVVAGETYDFSQYLTVNTNSTLASDKRVIWSLDGWWNDIDSNGMATINDNYSGNHTITATSVVDDTKSATINVNVIFNKNIKSYNTLNSIEVTQDLGICDFNTMFNALKGQLPTSLTAIGNNDETLVLPIEGWSFNNKTENSMTIIPNVRLPYGYDSNNEQPILTINFATSQTDNRTKVISGAVQTLTNEAIAVSGSGIVLNADRYATDSEQLMNVLFGNDGSVNDVVTLTATLEDNTSVELQCSLGFNYVTYDNYNNYNGTCGTAILHMSLILPEGYSYNGSSEMTIEQPVYIAVEQTPRYEPLWVTKQPKLEYTEGDLIDLSQIQVSVQDTTLINTNSVTYIGFNQFAEYGLEILTEWDGPVFSTETPLTMDKDQNYLILRNTNNDTTALIGPFHIISKDPTDTTTITIENSGAVTIGTTTQMKSDFIHVKWNVINQINNSNGEAIIDPETGMLEPITAGTVRVDAYSLYSDAIGTIEITIQENPNSINNVVSGSAINLDVNLDNDLFITNQNSLIDYIYPTIIDYKNVIPINVTLADNTTQNLQCTMLYPYGQYENSPKYIYDGSVGTFVLNMRVILPLGYLYNGSRAINISQKVHVGVSQTPKNERIWVTTMPKLTYTEGDIIDLSGLQVQLKDYMTQTIKTVSYEQFAENGLEIHMENPCGPILDSNLPIDTTLNGNYIYVLNTNDLFDAFIGPFTVLPIIQQ